MSDAIREAFEEWWMEGTGCAFPPSRLGENYGSVPANCAWLAWQAALQSQTAPAVPSVVAPELGGEPPVTILGVLSSYARPSLKENGVSDEQVDAWFQGLKKLLNAAPPSVAVPEGWKAKVLELCSAVENDEDLPPVKYALKCGRLINEVKDMLTAAPQPDQHPDDAAVDRFAAAMKSKLAKARDKGRGGWDDPDQCSVEFLADLLLGHVGKGNPGNFEDIANLAMMLHQRGAEPSVLTQSSHIADAGKVVAELDRIRGLIAQAPIDSLGTGHNDGSCPPWPIRDEIVDGLSKIIRALPATPSAPEEDTGKVVQGEPVAGRVRMNPGARSAIYRLCDSFEAAKIFANYHDGVGAPEPLYTHPAESREEIQAKGILEAVQHAKAKTAVNRGHNTVSTTGVLKYALSLIADTSGALDFEKALTARLRTSQQDDQGSEFAAFISRGLRDTAGDDGEGE